MPVDTLYYAGQRARASAFNALVNKDSVLPRGVIKRANRTTSSSTTTTEIGVEQLDDIPMYLGRTYRIWTSTLRCDTTVANDVARVNLRYTTDGSTPTTSSSVLDSAQTTLANATDGNTVVVSVDYTPTADELFSVLICVARQSGGGNISIIAGVTAPINIVVEDIGLDQGDSGVDI